MICIGKKEMIYLYLLLDKEVTLLVSHLDTSLLNAVAPAKATIIQTVVVVNVSFVEAAVQRMKADKNVTTTVDGEGEHAGGGAMVD